MLVAITPNSRIAPSSMLVSESFPGWNAVSVHAVSSPWMKSSRAGMLVMTLAAWSYAIAVSLTRARAIMLERESGTAWAKAVTQGARAA